MLLNNYHYYHKRVKIYPLLEDLASVEVYILFCFVLHLTVLKIQIILFFFFSRKQITLHLCLFVV